MLKSGFKRMASQILLSLIYLIIASLLALIISVLFNKKLDDIMFYTGLVIIVAGAMAMMKGNPSGIGLFGFGRSNAQYKANENLEVLRTERESTDYGKSYKNHPMAEWSPGNLSLILSGILTMLCSGFFA